MRSHRKDRTSRTITGPCALRAAALCVAGLTAWGCAAGHGKHTTKAINVAEQRMAEIKAATAWDMGRQQFLVGDLRKALDSVDQSIQLNSNVAKSHSLRGRILIELGQLEAAVESFRRAAAVDPGYVEAHYYLGIVHERFSDFESALASYTTAMQLDPSDAQHVVAAAEMLTELGRLDQAQALLESRHADFAHNAGVRQTMGHLAMLRDEPGTAVLRFREARMLAPDDPSVLEDLALAQMAAGEWAEAEYSLRQMLAVAENADRRDLKRMQARCLMSLDRPVEARSLLLSLADDPAGVNDVGVWIDLGEVALQVGDLNRVRIAATRVMTMAPQRSEGYSLLAAQHLAEGRLDAALATLEKAVARCKDDTAPAMLRSLLLHRAGRHDEAMSSLTQALRIDPGDERAGRLLSVVGEEH